MAGCGQRAGPALVTTETHVLAGLSQDVPWSFFPLPFQGPSSQSFSKLNPWETRADAAVHVHPCGALGGPLRQCCRSMFLISGSVVSLTFPESGRSLRFTDHIVSFHFFYTLATPFLQF